MKAYEMNPYIRYSNLHSLSRSYKQTLLAYDYRLFGVLGGSCTLVVDGAELSLIKDCCVVIPPATPYRFLCEAGASVTLGNINFSLAWLPGDGNPFNPEAAETFCPERMPERPEEELFPRTLLVKDAGAVCRRLSELVSEREIHEELGDEVCSAMLKGILLQLLRMARSPERAVPQPVSALARYLSEHCRETVTGKALGQMLGYHPFYLNKLFREHTGQTIHRYQMECRIKLACGMLASTRLSIKEISDSLGFANPAYFSETFKQHRRVTPTEYRTGLR